MPQYQIPYTSAWGATSEGLENEDAKAARRFPRNAQTAEVILAVFGRFSLSLTDGFVM